MERQQEDVGFQDFLDKEICRQQGEIQRQAMVYREGAKLRLLDGYTVILVDDGIATGSTCLASIHSLRRLGINRLIAAIPLGTAQTNKYIRTLVNHLDVLHIPEPFVAVGAHYHYFPQLEDQQVVQLLRTAHEHIPDHTTGSFITG